MLNLTGAEVQFMSNSSIDNRQLGHAATILFEEIAAGWILLENKAQSEH